MPGSQQSRAEDRQGDPDPPGGGKQGAGSSKEGARGGAGGPSSSKEASRYPAGTLVICPTSVLHQVRPGYTAHCCTAGVPLVIVSLVSALLTMALHEWTLCSPESKMPSPSLCYTLDPIKAMP